MGTGGPWSCVPTRVLVLCLLAVLSVRARAQDAQPEPSPVRAVGLEPGDLLPDLELMRVDGTGSVRLSELRGRRLLLIVYASW